MTLATAAAKPPLPSSSSASVWIGLSDENGCSRRGGFVKLLLGSFIEKEGYTIVLLHGQGCPPFGSRPNEKSASALGLDPPLVRGDPPTPERCRWVLQRRR